jgi:predicted MPP superfamily phosphohydrolase
MYRFFIFFAVMISVFSLIGYYIHNRLMQSFAGTFLQSRFTTVILILMATSMIAGYILQNFSINTFTENLIRVGAFALGVLFYLFIFFLFFDIVWLANHFLHFIPETGKFNIEKLKFISGLFTLTLSFAFVLYGYINANNTKIVNLELKTDKPLKDNKPINIVALSDIHLGTTVNHAKVDKMIEEINKLNPDVVLIGGDIIDNNIKVVKYHKLIERFSEIKSRYGIFTCMGNHDYISRAYLNPEYYEQNGINILKDTAVVIDGRFALTGRDDHSAYGITGKHRKALHELQKNIDAKLPQILIDHQPFDLGETSKLGFDFQFSGHTHRGQFWPLRYITSALFEKDWGYKKKGNTHFYISSGFGTSTIPMRIGTQSEIVNLILTN